MRSVPSTVLHCGYTVLACCSCLWPWSWSCCCCCCCGLSERLSRARRPPLGHRVGRVHVRIRVGSIHRRHRHRSWSAIRGTCQYGTPNRKLRASTYTSTYSPSAGRSCARVNVNDAPACTVTVTGSETAQHSGHHMVSAAFPYVHLHHHPIPLPLRHPPSKSESEPLPSEPSEPETEPNLGNSERKREAYLLYLSLGRNLLSAHLHRPPAGRKSTSISTSKSKSASCCIACAACQCLAILTSATFPPPHDSKSTHSHFPLGRYRSRCLAARKTLTLSLSLRRVRSWLCRRAILVPVPSIIHRALCIVHHANSASGPKDISFSGSVIPSLT